MAGDRNGKCQVRQRAKQRETETDSKRDDQTQWVGGGNEGYGEEKREGEYQQAPSD